MNTKQKSRPHLKPLIAAIAALCAIGTVHAKSLTAHARSAEYRI